MYFRSCSSRLSCRCTGSRGAARAQGAGGRRASHGGAGDGRAAVRGDRDDVRSYGFSKKNGNLLTVRTLARKSPGSSTPLLLARLSAETRHGRLHLRPGRHVLFVASLYQILPYYRHVVTACTVGERYPTTDLARRLRAHTRADRAGLQIVRTTSHAILAARIRPGEWRNLLISDPLGHARGHLRTRALNIYYGVSAPRHLVRAVRALIVGHGCRAHPRP